MVALKFLNSTYWSICFICISFLIVATSCSKKEKPKRPPPLVTTAVVEKRDIPIYIDTIGEVIPTVVVNIRPQVAGKLLYVYVNQGAIVKEGDLLYTVDPRPYQAALDQAKAQLVHDKALLEIAQKTVHRYKEVVEDDFISKLTFEQYQSNEAAASAQVAIDVAAIAAAQLNVDFCDVVAPVSGKISNYNVDVGNIVAVDDPNALTVIRPFSPIDILFSISQEQFELIRPLQGDAGEWSFVAVLPETPKVQYDGITFFLDNQINQDTGTILLKGRLPNKNWQLWPGEFVQVKVLYKNVSNALLVPPGGVLIGKDGPYIYLVDKDDKAQAYNVNVLTRTEEYIAIESKDVKEGDTVIVDGQINVATGLIVSSKSSLKQTQDTNPVTVP